MPGKLATGDSWPAKRYQPSSCGHNRQEQEQQNKNQFGGRIQKTDDTKEPIILPPAAPQPLSRPVFTRSLQLFSGDNRRPFPAPSFSHLFILSWGVAGSKAFSTLCQQKGVYRTLFQRNMFLIGRIKQC